MALDFQVQGLLLGAGFHPVSLAGYAEFSRNFCVYARRGVLHLAECCLCGGEEHPREHSIP